MNTDRVLVTEDVQPRTPSDNGSHEPSPAVLTAGWRPEAELMLSGRYRLQRLLGRGAMGSVFCAYDQKAQRQVAIKLLMAGGEDIAEDSDAMRRFCREATILAQLSHPNIVQIKELCHSSSGRPFIVMELLEGVDLHTYLHTQGPLSLTRTQEIISQVASALYAAHRIGIIHRDIKPRNIFVSVRSADGGGSVEVVKVVDFGLGKILGSPGQLTAEELIIGTPKYLSPEATLGTVALVDAKTDQWALAVCAYQLLSGTLPFEDRDIVQLISKIRAANPPPLSVIMPGIPPYAAAAIHRALSLRKEDRFESVLDFSHALRGGQASQQNQSRQDGFSMKDGRLHDAVGPADSSSVATLKAPVSLAFLQSLQREVGACPHSAEHDQQLTQRMSSAQLERLCGVSSERMAEDPSQFAPVLPLCPARNQHCQEGSAPRGMQHDRFFLASKVNQRSWTLVLLLIGTLAAALSLLPRKATDLRSLPKSSLLAPLSRQNQSLPEPSGASGSTQLSRAPGVVTTAGPSPTVVQSSTPSVTRSMTAISDGTGLPSVLPRFVSSGRSRAGQVVTSRGRFITGQKSTASTSQSTAQNPASIPASEVEGLAQPVAAASPPARLMVESKPSAEPSAALSKSTVEQGLHRVAGEDPTLPAIVRSLFRGEQLTGSYLMCIGERGTVESIRAVRSVPTADDSIIKTLRTWRYLPIKARACHLEELIFEIHE
jgi:hypothetical protein